MATIHIRHVVRDFATWKQAFDVDPLRRGRHGVRRHVIFQAVHNPNDVIVLLHFGTLAEAEVYFTELHAMFPGVDEAVGFGPEGIQARIVDEVESLSYPGPADGGAT